MPTGHLSRLHKRSELSVEMCLSRLGCFRHSCDTLQSCPGQQAEFGEVTLSCSCAPFCKFLVYSMP
jgi:hypothetical protein